MSDMTRQPCACSDASIAASTSSSHWWLITAKAERTTASSSAKHASAAAAAATRRAPRPLPERFAERTHSTTSAHAGHATTAARTAFMHRASSCTRGGTACACEVASAASHLRTPPPLRMPVRSVLARSRAALASRPRRLSAAISASHASRRSTQSTSGAMAASGSSACWRSRCTSVRPCASTRSTSRQCDASSGRSEPKHACSETARFALVPPAA